MNSPPTALREEAALLAALEGPPLRVERLPDGEPVWSNDGMRACAGASLDERLHDEDRERLRVHRETLAAAGPGRVLDVTLRLHGDEGWRTMRLTDRRARAADGTPLACGTLVECGQDAPTDMPLRDEFVGLASHELRTPLNAMVGWLHVLQSPDVPAAVAQRAAGGLSRAVDQQRELIDALLEAARARRRDLHFNRDRVELRPLLEQAVARRAQASGSRGLEVALETEPGLALMGDAERLARVLDELVAHAGRLRSDPRTLRVEGIHRDGRVRLSLWVDDDEAAGTWRPFDDSVPLAGDVPGERPSLRQRGLTIGLVLARELVRLLGGTVRVEGERGMPCARLVMDFPPAAD